MGSPPTSGVIKTIHKNQYFKELLSLQPVHKGRTKAIQPRIEKLPNGDTAIANFCRNIIASDA
jgi:hypothetical protein